MTAVDPIRVLRDAVVEAGSQKAWAQANGFSPAYVNDVLQGRREPAGAILDALGIEKVVFYRQAGQLHPEAADERRRREVSKLTSLSYDDLRAKLLSLSTEGAADELGVSIELIKEFRGRLGVVEWRARP